MDSRNILCHSHLLIPVYDPYLRPYKYEYYIIIYLFRIEFEESDYATWDWPNWALYYP